MIGGKHDDGILSDPGPIDRIEKSANVPVEVRRHRIIVTHPGRDLFGIVMVVRPSIAIRVFLLRIIPWYGKLDIFEQIAPFLGHIPRSPRTVRRADAEHQEEWFLLIF